MSASAKGMSWVTPPNSAVNAVLLLGSKGAAGVAGAAFVVLAVTLASVGSVPVESVALILGVHRLLSEGMTPTKKALDEKRLQAVLDREIDPATPSRCPPPRM